MKKIFLFALLVLSATAFATWSYFPVPKGTGFGFRLIESGYDNTAGEFEAESRSLNADMRFYTHGLEFTVVSPAYVSVTENEESTSHATDFVFGVRYQLASVFNVFVDLDLFSFDSDYNSHYLEAGAQFSVPFTPSFVLGSQVGVQNIFEKDGFNPGLNLDLALELDKTFFKKLTIFAVYEMQIQLDDDQYDGFAEGGAGDTEYQVTFGASFAFTKSVALEVDWVSYDSVFSTEENSLVLKAKFSF